MTLLHLPAFRRGIEEQLSNSKYAELSFEERLSLLVDLEVLSREWPIAPSLEKGTLSPGCDPGGF